MLLYYLYVQYWINIQTNGEHQHTQKRERERAHACVCKKKSDQEKRWKREKMSTTVRLCNTAVKIVPLSFTHQSFLSANLWLHRFFPYSLSISPRSLAYTFSLSFSVCLYSSGMPYYLFSLLFPTKEETMLERENLIFFLSEARHI